MSHQSQRMFISSTRTKVSRPSDNRGVLTADQIPTIWSRLLFSRLWLAIGIASFIISFVVVAPLSARAATSPVPFTYTGSGQQWQVPPGVTFAKFELYGAQGGTSAPGSSPASGGNGAYLTGTLPVSSGDIYTICVGGQGGQETGGFNGGGQGDFVGGTPTPKIAGGGGGATDVRLTAIPGDCSTASLGDRKLVAGGGGGGGGTGRAALGFGKPGGNGGSSGSPGNPGTDDSLIVTGGQPGQNGTDIGGDGGAGGTNSVDSSLNGADGVKGDLGVGGGGPGIASGADGGGGGGGYYGGGSGGGGARTAPSINSSGAGGGGGGGGSNYTDPSASNTSVDNGFNAGNGQLVITLGQANIQISPLSSVKRVGGSQTLTGHVNVNDGSGFTNAPAGTTIHFSKDSGPGTLSASTCTTVGTTGDCSVTITSGATGATGVSSVSASADYQAVHVTTDGQGANSDSASVRWVDAKIEISGGQPIAKQAGDSHIFTVFLSQDIGDGSGFQPVTGAAVDVTLTDSGGATHSIVTDKCATQHTDGFGACEITFTALTAGTITGSASATLSIAGSDPITVSTDGTGNNSDPVAQVFIGANIQISPSSSAERVGGTNSLTGHVNVNDGSGFQNAADGTLITFTITSLSDPGSFVGGNNTCHTSGGTGSCSVDITSDVTGRTHVKAEANYQGLHVVTNGLRQNSTSSLTQWVDAKISVDPPSATRPVSQNQTFTVTLEKDSGDGAGFVAADNQHVDFTLTNSNGANWILDAGNSTCDNPGSNTDSNGQCTIRFRSNSAGQVSVSASSSVDVNGLVIEVSTDGQGNNSDAAVMTFTDARVQVSPFEITRRVGTQTFTASVTVNDGSGSGYVSAPDGTVVTFSNPTDPGRFSNGQRTITCATSGGSCQVDFTSGTTGTTTIYVDALSGSDSATVHWVDAKISVAPLTATDPVGNNHTFTVTLMQDSGSGFVPAPNKHVNFTLTESNGAISVFAAGNSTCDDAGSNTDSNGQCTITFKSNSPGKVTVSATSTLSVGFSAPFTVTTDNTGHNSDVAVETFTDANIQISPSSSVKLVGGSQTLTGHVNVNDGSGAEYVDAPVGTTINFTKSSGPGTLSAASCTTTTASGSCTVTLTSPSQIGIATVSASTNLTVNTVSVSRSTDGTHGSSNPAKVTWTYKFLGFTSPVPNSQWQAGRTIPVKFKLGNINNVPISDADALALASGSPCRVKVSLTNVAMTTTYVGPICVSYNSSAHQFSTNLNTPKSLVAGNYNIVVQIFDTATPTRNLNTTASETIKIKK